jgi:ribonuclease Z
MQLRKFGINLSRIHHIFISHLHGDHVFGLYGLLSSLGMMGRRNPLYLYGPERLEEMIRSHLQFFGPLPFELSFHHPGPVREENLYEDDKITVNAVPLKHRTKTFGYLFREKKRLLNVRKEAIREYGLGIADLVRIKQGEDITRPDGSVIDNQLLTLPPYRPRSFAYISDTLFDRELVDRIRNVDLLFHEATFSGRDEKLALETYHSTAPQAAQIAREAGVGQLLIGHFSSRYKDHSILVEEAREIFLNTAGVTDGDVYSLPQERGS